MKTQFIDKYSSITAAILTKNEQNNIERAIKGVKFCQELIVIDDHSSDKTVTIAKKLGATVYKHKLHGNYAQQRNFALKKAKHTWVLFVDADEFITPELTKSILKAIKDNNYEGYYLNRKDVFMGKSLNHGEWGNQWLLRLAKKASGHWKRSVHEYWDIKGKTQRLNGVLLHFPHTTLASFIKSISVRSKIHASELEKENKNRFTSLRLTIYPLGKFLRNMLFHRGFLDGTHGFVFAGLLSFQSFISWSHLWLKKHRH